MEFLLKIIPHDEVRKPAAITEHFDYKDFNLSAEKQFKDRLIKISNAPMKARNDTLSKQAYSSFMLRRYIPVESIESDLICAGLRSGLRQGEVRKTVESAKNKALTLEPDDFSKRRRHKR